MQKHRCFWATKEVAEYVDKVKRKPEVESGFMTLQDKIDLEKESSYNEGLEQGIEQGIKAFVLDKKEDNCSEEEILVKLQKRFQLPEEKAKYFLEKYNI